MTVTSHSAKRAAVIFAAILTAGICAAVAGAATQGSVTITLTPDRPSADSSLKLVATGPFRTTSSQLRSAAIEVQKGFVSSPRSVAKLCTASAAANGTCPAASRVGGGKAVATGTLGTSSRQDTIAFTIFLGVPHHAGDIASIVLSGSDSVFHKSFSVSGRLFKPAGGGLEILFGPFQGRSLPPGTKVTLDRLELHASAVRTVTVHSRVQPRSVTYSLITNPPSCAGAWRSTIALTFQNGSAYTRQLTTPCSRG